MRVALLSFHNALNYGAVLQSYGLQYALKALGIDCEYIDYQNDYRKNAYDMKHHFLTALKNRNCTALVRTTVGAPLIALRAKAFRRFVNDNINVTDSAFSSSEEASVLNDKYEKFIVGSDQVWNWSNNGGDSAYLLDFVSDDRKKISYASSFGTQGVSAEARDKFALLLAKFYRLSVREEIGAEIVKRTSGRNAHVVLDPVFLVSRDEWSRLCKSCRSAKKKYIFFYTNRSSQIQEFLDTGYATNELFHVLSTHLSLADLVSMRIRTRIAMSPNEFLSEIANADLIVTASFHCVALSIILHKQFVVLLTGDYGKDERIWNLLRITGLENRVVTSTTTSQDINMLIDYVEVDRRLKPYLCASNEYLRRAVCGEEDIAFNNDSHSRLFCMDSRCTGCGCCASSCPRGAIKMECDSEGFLVPKLDKAKCIACGLCHSVCQVYSSNNTQCAPQRYYAAKNTDEVRRESSSGGVFSALAKSIFAENGVVCAAGMDKKFHVSHMFATSMDELLPMRGTYYVQSDLRDCYRRVKEYLQHGVKILFVGTPCQVMGLREYLRNDNENLIMCDIVCHGVPSPMVFDMFKRYLESKGNLTSFRFRDKNLGWRGYQTSAIIDGLTYNRKLWLQSFNNMFSHNLINRLSCCSCRYSNYNRVGDITIGDFWGIEKNHSDICDSLGVSLVITNNQKGDAFVNGLNLDFLREVKKEDTYQRSLDKPASVGSNRARVFRSLKERGYVRTMHKYGEVNLTGYIKDKIRRCFYR